MTTVKQNIMNTDYQLSKEEFAVIGTLKQEICRQIDRSHSVEENLIAAYMHHCPDASRDEAARTTDRLMKGISTFSRNYEEFRQDPGTVDRRLDEALAGLEPRRKYVCLLQLTAALRSLDSRSVASLLRDAGADLFARFDELVNDPIEVEGEVSDEELAELTTRFKEAINGSTLCMTGAEELSSLIHDVAADPDAARKFVGERLSEIEETAYTALAACLAYRDGRLASLPEDIDIEALAMGIAAGVERNRVIADAQSGLISWDTAFTLLKWIGGALIVGTLVLLTAKVAVLGALIVTMISAGLLGGTLFGMIVGAVLGTVLMFRFVMWATDGIFDVAESLGHGYDKAVEYLRERLIPAIAGKIRAFCSYLRSLFERAKVTLSGNRRLEQDHDQELAVG